MSRRSNLNSVYLPLLLHLFSLTTAFAFPVAAAAKLGEETDHFALLDIKSKIHSGGSKYKGLLESWNDSTHHCNWKGVTCGSNRRITILNLGSQGLFGSLSPAIGNLTFMEELTFEDNKFYGKIPPEIGHLSRLRVLVAINNSLEGEIPVNLSLCRNLKMLILSGNKLHGNIPHEFSSLTGLKNLGLTKNMLTGGLDILGNLTSLEVLSISYNGFRGQIPSTIGRLKRLTMLFIGANYFTGQLPPSIYNLSLLEVLSFGGSSISGSLPQNLGVSLPHLQTLQVFETQLEGPIPMSLSNLSHIEVIELANSRFSGKIQIDGQNLKKLNTLDLSTNHLGSRGGGDLDFLHSLVNCSHLFRLFLGENHLGGVLPSSIANISSLNNLYLAENLIAGNIPPGLEKLVNLQVLSLNKNRFTGNIPNDIGKLKKLSELRINKNDFSGSIPTSLGNLSQLLELRLDDNQLQGPIPPSLGELTSLQVLNLEKNKLIGEIPPHIFHACILCYKLSLHGNQLRGSLPIEIGQLQNVEFLDISDNKLSGNIPQSLGQCNSLTELSMDGNSFTGFIPESLSSLKGLLSLDLSRNNLSGQIPSYLSDFALISLNLSFNDLVGEVPMKGIFTNASRVSLKGNERLCGGITQLHLHTCIKSSQEKKKTLLMILLFSLLSLIGMIVVLLLILFLLKSRQKNNSSASPLQNSSNFLRVSYHVLLKATEGFSSRNLIGMGGFGAVYHGVLKENGKATEIAAKVFNLQHGKSEQSFMRECAALKNIRHRNLVSIVSACSSTDFQGNDFKAIVYELMPKGNLDQWLHMNPVSYNGLGNQNQSIEPQSLNLLQRINIAIDVACALDYLHHDCETQIIHCDLKPSNILLDNEMVAHVGDFGLARMLSKEIIRQSLSSSAGLQGTIGYAPPEYGIDNQISTRGDVYSYGIILLEMMTAKKPTSQMFQNSISLHDYARIAVCSNVMKILDPKLLKADETITMESVVSVIRVGIQCSVKSPQDRMNIKYAIRELMAAKDIHMGTTRV